MNEEKKHNDLAEKLKRNKYVAFVLLLVAIVGGVESFTNSISNLVNRFVNKDGTHPELIQFSLNSERTSYYESMLPRFADGPSVRTYLNSHKVPDSSSLEQKPVWQVTLSNPSDIDMILTDIKYHVSDIGQVMGGEPGPLLASYEYIHELKYEKGSQSQVLVPPFKVPAKSSGAFDLVLFTEHPDIGLGWIMKIEFITNIGSVSTEEFQLYLSGSPDWALDMQVSKITWKVTDRDSLYLRQISSWFSASLKDEVMKKHKCPDGFRKVRAYFEPHWSLLSKHRVIIECRSISIGSP
ncbi:hypothetical protein AL190_004573 [Vibrio parahaemolyticus]|uniref:hypothetical protein n=1 Tax=Vibrio parahaemolyticus TaxID=670 RepID=UPI00402B691F|nr:hypothetical protein [Vibrio parahaemolyticus]EJE4735888.1 hypothetical protein [Vibrio parahaemolyticus]MDG2749097.1 hypothetical protein [Vibrio parahaemolyticus]